MRSELIQKVGNRWRDDGVLPRIGFAGEFRGSDTQGAADAQQVDVAPGHEHDPDDREPFDGVSRAFRGSRLGRRLTVPYFAV
jgi:hypothetical protein